MPICSRCVFTFFCSRSWYSHFSETINTQWIFAGKTRLVSKETQRLAASKWLTEKKKWRFYKNANSDFKLHSTNSPQFEYHQHIIMKFTSHSRLRQRVVCSSVFFISSSLKNALLCECMHGEWPREQTKVTICRCFLPLLLCCGETAKRMSLSFSTIKTLFFRQI